MNLELLFSKNFHNILIENMKIFFSIYIFLPIQIRSKKKMSQKINKKLWDWKYGIQLCYEKYKDMEVINLNVKDLYLMISEYLMECPLELNSIYYIQTGDSLEYFKIVLKNNKKNAGFIKQKKRKNPEINSLCENFCIESNYFVSYMCDRDPNNPNVNLISYLEKVKDKISCECPDEDKVQLYHNEFNMYYPTSTNTELSWNVYLKIYRNYNDGDDYVYPEYYHGTISMDGKYISCSVYWEKLRAYRTVIFEKL